MTSKTTVLAVVVFLGAFALVALGCVTWLLHDNKDATVVAVIAGPMGVALGALASVLASTRTEPANPPSANQIADLPGKP